MKSSISLVSSLTFCLVGSSFQLSPASAQVTADGTTNTTVNPDGDNFIIEQGDRVGDNLFHSFEDFSVPTMGSAAFNNANDIANIFSRVTGSNISNIDGLIGANGTANLYLINPNGIIFGENARLNLGGSFFASTADSLLFDGGLEFSASNPTAPPLIEVNIPIGLGFRDNPGDIVNRSHEVDSNENTVGLQMQPGKNITFAGGNITFDGGTITAPGGKVELGGLAAAGTVGLNDDGSLSFTDNLERADFQLTNDASVNVRAGGGGFITVSADNVELSEGSTLLAGIKLDMGSPNAEGGDITINSTGSVSLTNGSQFSIGVFGQGNGGNVIINAKDRVLFDGVSSDGFPSAAFSTIREEGEGNAGNIGITTSSLSLANGGWVDSSTFGKGNAGSIAITANEITIDSENSPGFIRGIGSQVALKEAIGNTGDITVRTDYLSLINGGKVYTNTFGQGNAGVVEIIASEAIEIEGESSDGFPSEIVSQVNSGAKGDAGGVNINTKFLSLASGGQIGNSLFGKGNTGSLNIIASEIITIDGERIDSYPSNVSSVFATEAEGDIGNITISTESLYLSNGGRINVSTGGTGNAGSVEINAADIILIDGENSFGIPSGIGSQVIPEAEGNAGNISITTKSLSLNNGGTVSVSTFGQGNAGLIKIFASDTIAIDGERTEGFPSGLVSQVYLGAEGNGGNIDITTNSLSLTNGGQIDTSTGSQGNAGLIKIFANDTINIDGEQSWGVPSGVTSQVIQAEGNAGGVNINTKYLSLTNGGRVDASTLGKGDAGSVEISASDTITIDGEQSDGFPSNVSSAVDAQAEGNAGGVNISTKYLSLTSGGRVDASTLGKGDAGSVEISASDTITIDGHDSDGLSSAVSSEVNSQAEGNAGGINLDTKVLSLTNGGRITASTRGQGNSGLVEINAIDIVTIDGDTLQGLVSGITSQVNPGAEGDAGGITINTNSLSLTNGGIVDASTGSLGNAGDVTVNASESIFISSATETESFRSGISADAFVSSGDGGNINVSTNRLTIDDGGTIEAGNIDNLEVFAPGTGQPGNINIEANFISLNQGRIEATTQSEIGEGGNINLTIAEDIFFKNNSLISARAFGNANGGNVTINANNGSIVAFPNQNNDIIANAQQGNGGNINITTQAIFGLEERPENPFTNDIDASSEFGLQGSFSLNTPENEPSRGLIDLPENVVNPEDLISQNACKQGGQSKFTLTGRGGLPATPEQVHHSDEVEVDLVKPAMGVAAISKESPVAEDSTKIEPAFGWIRNEQGEVFLVGYDPTVSNLTPQSENLDLCQPQGND